MEVRSHGRPRLSEVVIAIRVFAWRCHGKRRPAAGIGLEAIGVRRCDGSEPRLTGTGAIVALRPACASQHRLGTALKDVQEAHDCEVDDSAASATFKNGVLTVTVPKSARAVERAKKIPINVSGKSH